MGRVVFALGALATAVAAGTAAGYVSLTRPVGGEAHTVLTVNRGATIRPILKKLHDEGVLRAPGLLYGFARLTGRTSIRSGEYEIRAAQSPIEVLETLVQGRVRLEKITLAEGLNRWQVRDTLSEAKWMTPAEFDSLCDDDAFISGHELPGPNCEGYLFPETYTFARGVPPTRIMSTFFAAYHREFRAATAAGAGPMDLSERDLVTLASSA